LLHQVAPRLDDLADGDAVRVDELGRLGLDAVPVLGDDEPPQGRDGCHLVLGRVLAEEGADLARTGDGDLVERGRAVPLGVREAVRGVVGIEQRVECDVVLIVVVAVVAVLGVIGRSTARLSLDRGRALRYVASSSE
jgi:hypothetical protein